MNASSPHSTDWYLAHLAADVDRLAAVLDRGPLDAPVEACPGWDVARLAKHLGGVHRWSRQCAIDAAPPETPPAPRAEDESWGDWLRRGAGELADTLRTIDPDAPTWHPFPVEQVAGVWARRQAHETAMHRWDAQRAVGEPGPIDAELASDGIDEYFELAIPRILVRDAVDVPTSSLHVHCTDVDGEWLVWNEDGEYRMKRAHEKGDAALRGPAEAILLRLWGRTSPRADELSPVGDETALAAWLALAGM